MGQDNLSGQSESPYFLTYKEFGRNPDSNNLLDKIIAFIIYTLKKIWPTINKLFNWAFFDGLRLLKTFVKYAVRQIGFK